MGLILFCILANVIASILVSCYAYNKGFTFWKILVGGLCFSAPVAYAYLRFADIRDYE